jgi:hypothetical protein
LHADDFQVRLDGLAGDARSCCATAAADRHDQDIDVGLGLEQLERRRSDPGDQVRLVAGVDVAVAVLARETFRVLPGLVEVPPVDDELRAEPLHRRELDRVRALGDAHDRAHTEDSCRERDRLAMVARRRGDDAAPALVLAQLRDEVDAAADLEGADRQVVLVLDEDFGADELAQRAVRVERRRLQVRRDPAPRVHDVGEGRELQQRRAHASPLSCSSASA